MSEGMNWAAHFWNLPDNPHVEIYVGTVAIRVCPESGLDMVFLYETDETDEPYFDDCTHHQRSDDERKIEEDPSRNAPSSGNNPRG